MSCPLVVAASAGIVAAVAAASSLSASSAPASWVSRRKGERGSEADHTLSTGGMSLREEEAEKERKRGSTGPGCGLPSYGALSDCGGEGTIWQWGGEGEAREMGWRLKGAVCVCVCVDVGWWHGRRE